MRLTCFNFSNLTSEYFLRKCPIKLNAIELRAVGFVPGYLNFLVPKVLKYVFLLMSTPIVQQEGGIPPFAFFLHKSLHEL